MMGNLMEEAVNFLGICTALYSLPSSFQLSQSDNDNGNNDNDNDTFSRTKSIYFGNSTLVFIPLESSTNIVAIVQISRSYHGSSNNNNNNVGGTTTTTTEVVIH